jgi:hypothetical protein
MAAAPSLQTEAGVGFGDGAFQPDDMCTIHGVNNLEDGLRAKVIAYDVAAMLYVVKDANAQVWGLQAVKLRPQVTLDLSREWQEVPEGVAIPGQVEVMMDLTTGKKLARLAEDA